MFGFFKKFYRTKPYDIGLALGGGGAKGFSHIGAIKALEDRGLRPHVVAGVSAGSVVGALYCDGYSPDEIEDIFASISYRDMVGLRFPTTSLLTMDPFLELLKKHLRAKRFEDLDTPLVIVATDLDRAKRKEFVSGNLLQAISASCTIPVVFPPVQINGTNYVDGGVLQNFPASVLRQKCEQLIGINVTPMVSSSYRKTLVGIALQSFSLMAKSNSFEDRKLCDLLIEIEDVDPYKIYDIRHRKQIIDIGYQSALLDIDGYLCKKKK